MRLDTLHALNAARAARQAALLVTDLEGGEQRLVAEPDLAADPLAEELRERLRTGRSGIVEAAGRRWFVTVQAPPVRVIAVGAVHISQALAPMADQLGFDVVIVDPRTAFASAERFPGLDLRPDWPDEALPALGLDRSTALLALTHDPKIDDPALIRALGAPCFYVGALGSRRTHAARVERLGRAGILPAEIARIHAPIGLDIGAMSPAEIALSILAELVTVLRGGGRRAR